MGRKKKELTKEEFVSMLVKDEGWYVSNDYLLPELRLCAEQDRLTDNMGLMFTAIAKKWANKLKYKCQEDKEDCVMTAVRDCLLYWKSFNSNPQPTIDENGHVVFNEDGTVHYDPPTLNVDYIPFVVSLKESEVDDSVQVIERGLKGGKVKCVRLNEDGTVKMKELNPFGYFSSVCLKGLAKGWDALGYKNCPFNNRVYITENIFSI